MNPDVLKDPTTAALRMLAVDAVEAANSGHPGAPLGMAEIAAVLWQRHLRHDPSDPSWLNRDRFVLSNGHGSMLLYALLHLTGYDLPVEELKNFRQFGSRTAGHPEYGVTPGVETTTGPLGQGFANAVGMALAERLLALEFNRPNMTVIDHRTFAFVGDGCLMEGISHEAASLAGTLASTVGLGKLVVFYDDNGISIDGDVEAWFSEDTATRFEAYGWQVIRDVNGHDPDAVDRALVAGLEDNRRPTLICCRTTIGMGAPTKEGGHDVHGAPLGATEIAAMRKRLNWSYEPFEIPQSVYTAWDHRTAGATEHSEWTALFESYRSEHPDLAAELLRRTSGKLPADWDIAFAEAIAGVLGLEDVTPVATRKASQLAIEALAPTLPELFGGSADLTGSNLTNWSGSVPLDSKGGNYLSYGVREFGMAAIMNGMALHGGFIPYGGTFLMFSEYARNAIRMAALMGIRSIFVLTHDSIALGEDGPTHQPVEQTATLRLMPNLRVWRPADRTETLVAWAEAIRRNDGPTALILSRQNLPEQRRSAQQAAGILRGGYVLVSVDDPELVFVATGSEVELCVRAAAELAVSGHRIQVVSMPCVEIFREQPHEVQAATLPAGVPRIVVEAGATYGWHEFSGGGRIIGIDSYGHSGPAAALLAHAGLTVDRMVEEARQVLQTLPIV